MPIEKRNMVRDHKLMSELEVNAQIYGGRYVILLVLMRLVNFAWKSGVKVMWILAIIGVFFSLILFYGGMFYTLLSPLWE